MTTIPVKPLPMLLDDNELLVKGMKLYTEFAVLLFTEQIKSTCSANYKRKGGLDTSYKPFNKV